MRASLAWNHRKPRASLSFSAIRIAYTLKEVMWAGVFLLLIMYVFSLALTQGEAAPSSASSWSVPVLHGIYGIVNYP